MGGITGSKITDICAEFPYAPAYEFRYDNYGGKDWALPLFSGSDSMLQDSPVYILESDWVLVSWTFSSGLAVRPRAKGIAVMLIAPDGEQVWFHWVDPTDTIHVSGKLVTSLDSLSFITKKY